MNLNDTQIDLLRSIDGKIRQGDIKLISERDGLSREYVGRVLNENYDSFNEDVVNIAVEIISERERDTKSLLKKLSS